MPKSPAKSKLRPMRIIIDTDPAMGTLGGDPEDGFAITLNFGDAPEPLYVPFDAIRTFVDPSVEFGLRFESGEDEAASEPVLASVDAETSEDRSNADGESEGNSAPDLEKGANSAPKKDADVVSLDSFRK